VQPASIDAIRAALALLSPDMSRDEWARVLMAIKSELGADGYAIADTWSQSGSNYDAKAFATTWKSIKAGGKVTIGTLFYLAKEQGYKPDINGAASTLPAKEIEALKRARRERDRRERLETEAAQRAAADEAQRLWDESTDAGVHGYLARKGVNAYGVRVAIDGRLLVPQRDVDGTLWAVQRIAPDQPGGEFEKLYIKGSRKSGLMHCCGDLAGAAIILLCEGYATGASLHEASGRPVVITFDAGNLPTVAKLLQERYPAARFIICADDDCETAARIDRNPGLLKAEEAAQLLGARAVVVKPAGQPERNTDFNDVHADGGLDAVRSAMVPAIEAATLASQGAAGAAVAAGERPNAHQAGDARPATQPLNGIADRFRVDDTGVWYSEPDSDGELKTPIWVCTRLDVVARTRNDDGREWGLLLVFADPDRRLRTWSMPARMLAGDGNELRGALLEMGLQISFAKRGRELLLQYILSRRPDDRARCVDQLGWYGAAYVLPNETLGDIDERVIFQAEGVVDNKHRQKGKPGQWRKHVGRYCVGNTRLAFAVSCAFGGVLIKSAGIGSGGFHLVGISSEGKTLAARMAASVWGGEDFKEDWRATSNAVESIAMQARDGFLILDELQQVDPREAGDVAFMLGNGQGKARSTRNGQARPRQTWRLLFLSTGNAGLAAHMLEAGKRANAGQEVRMAEIPADAGAGMGVFEQLHGFDTGATLAPHLEKACLASYGTAGRAFLEWAVANVDTLRERVRSDLDQLAQRWIPEGSSGQVERVGLRFALVAVAGELATEVGITGWPKGEAVHAAKTCFNAWLALRGGTGNSEDLQILRQVRRILESDGDLRFTDEARSDDSRAPRTPNQLGFRKLVHDDAGDHAGWEYFVFIEQFRSQICTGFPYKQVLELLRARGCLRITSGRAFDCSFRPRGDRSGWFYCIKPNIFDRSGDE
jgi:putative DNA primase/helicase